MRPRLPPRQLQPSLPGHVLSLRLALSQVHLSLSLPVFCSSWAPLFFLLPSFRAPLLVPSPSAPPCAPLLHCRSSSWLRLSVLPSFTSPASSPSPFLALLCRCPSPPPRCPVWPKDKSQGETSKDKQGAVTSLSSLICHFSSSHKGQSLHRLNSGLAREAEMGAAFSALSLSQPLNLLLLLLPAFISRQGVSLVLSFYSSFFSVL